MEKALKVLIVTPASAGSRKGNRITTLRWGRILRELGCRVAISERYERQSCDVLIALHALKSHESILKFQTLRGGRPLILVLTGTDLHHDIHHSAEARLSMEWAERIVVLHELGIPALSPENQVKTRLIYQSCIPLTQQPAKNREWFDICVVGHMRAVKDPFRTADASRLVTQDIPLRILHAGEPLSADMEQRLFKETQENPRYQWLGNLQSWKTRRLIAKSQAMVISSLMEGGANVVSEACVLGTPVLASRIDGNIGLLGSDYQGYFPAQDTKALALLIEKIVTQPDFLQKLREHVTRRGTLFTPENEKNALKNLLNEVIQ
ncbi:MAG: TIGR04348 family glycosyltransferase [SAR324 cluster bacterium]|nr:TIGR04348 family glycosyltransferase [SAR324 cluster bacterium]